MKLVLIGMAVMAVTPQSLVPLVLLVAVAGAVVATLGRTEYPTFETLTENRAMALAADPRLKLLENGWG